MKQSFTKKDLLTGDIIEERNGDRGVVILEKRCILYQNGGLDELDIFTEDLFNDGPFRCGDIFRVDGPSGTVPLSHRPENGPKEPSPVVFHTKTTGLLPWLCLVSLNMEFFE